MEKEANHNSRLQTATPGFRNMSALLHLRPFPISPASMLQILRTAATPHDTADNPPGPHNCAANCPPQTTNRQLLTTSH